MSLTSKVVAGADVRSLRNRKTSGTNKRILPLSQDDMQKSKVCDEMINFEKQDPQFEKEQYPFSYGLPESSVLPDFESSLAEFIKKLENGTDEGQKHFYKPNKEKKIANKLQQIDQNVFPTVAEKTDAKEISEFQIRNFTIKYSQILSFITHVYNQLDDTIAKSNNNPQEVFDKTEQGYDRHYLMLVANEKVYGIAIINYD